jgi:uncharacterized protein (DUF58 family)
VTVAARGRLVERSYLYRFSRRVWQQRLTSRGRVLLPLSVALAFLGVDTRQALGFVLFAFAAGPLAVALVLVWRRAPRVEIRGALPTTLTAGRTVATSVEIAPAPDAAAGPLVLTRPAPLGDDSSVRVEPAEAFVECEPGRPVRVRLEVTAERRGRYRLPGLMAGRTDPLGLFCAARVQQPERFALVYPPFYEIDEFPVPVGRRHQPGGIPLASSVGDSIEFIGTREYRPGDPLRRIHWRSWARRGKPVVKEHQEEYFSRIALVLDTFVPGRVRRGDRDGFEAAVSVLASLADHLARSEEVVDVLIAGPEVYEVTAGRSLGSLENVLRVLACVEPCARPPFADVTPRLFDRLARLTTVVAVLLDWDEPRLVFLRRLRALGVAVRVVLVRRGRAPDSFAAVGDELGGGAFVSVEDVQRRLEARA